MEDRTRDSRSGWGAVGKGMVSTFDLGGVKLHAEKSLCHLCYYFPPTFSSHTRQQGSVCFGGPDVNAVTCVLAAQDLARTLPWFAASVRDIRMMRIEELNDLMSAVRQAT